MQKKLLLTVFTVFIMFATATVGVAADWILESKSGKLPADLATLVINAGGTLVKSLDEVGIATAEFATREEAEAMEAHGFTVMPDIELNWLPGAETTDMNQEADATGADAILPHPLQWNMYAVDAAGAWNAGYTGAGVRVAIVDSGVDYLHYELLGKVDYAASATFVPGTIDCMDDNGHGTHVAGIVAADGFLKGVAPDATIIGVKVLAGSGSGSTSWVMAGVLHAIDADADIINMSLGSYVYKNGVPGSYTAKDIAEIRQAYKKIFTYAKQQGSLVVVSAGNSAMNLDTNGNLMKLPGEVSGCMVVSATGPLWGQDPDRLASYSNYGASRIAVAAPGGDFAGAPAPGYHYDMIVSSWAGGSYMWAAGTSQAAPMVSGVAALALQANPNLKPKQLHNHVANTADDVGPNLYFGKGRVNAYRAVTE